MGDVALGAGAANAAGSYLLRDVEFSNPYSAPALAGNSLLSEGGAATTMVAGVGTTMPPLSLFIEVFMRDIRLWPMRLAVRSCR
ncbi:MAG: hypothetical protein QOI58_1677 [Thermoanaerobaculia bacterium]|jgi:hypothetical protein|nr:hypothetical protein [Thermoanaerobaculia bacterium]